ncbi:MAG: hypothetical protein LBR12_06265 [Opitutaceae bacterium]|jgi:glucose/arabinose dehydrogenase|nr:hypothetical protein [Opitutaceae bacterium]
MRPAGIFLLLPALLLAPAACNQPVARPDDSLAAANRKEEAENSPFRWRALRTSRGDAILVRVLADNLPNAATRFTPEQQQQMFAALARLEAAKGRPAPETINVKALADGRELWLLKTLGPDGVAYPIAITPAENGALNVRIEDPVLYQK